MAARAHSELVQRIIERGPTAPVTATAMSRCSVTAGWRPGLSRRNEQSRDVELLTRAQRARSASDAYDGAGRRDDGDPPTVEEIIAVVHAASDDHAAVRLRALIVVLWRAGLRISEALALSESDPDLHRGAILSRRGKRGKRREVGMDRWAWEQLGPWLQPRAGPQSVHCSACCVPDRGPRVGTRRSSIAATPRPCTRWVRRRFAPHQLRHAHAVEMSREGVPLLVIQRELGHADLAITSVYFRRIDTTEIVHAVHERPAPMIPATHGLENLTYPAWWGAVHAASTARRRSIRCTCHAREPGHFLPAASETHFPRRLLLRGCRWRGQVPGRAQ